ncbi:MAG: type II and III secretion system protein family protein [Desulfobulbaceae bacterium]|nr:type II and III secretion system protein family protein [Desulfobulbaceae bacterium]
MKEQKRLFAIRKVSVVLIPLAILLWSITDCMGEGVPAVEVGATSGRNLTVMQGKLITLKLNLKLKSPKDVVIAQMADEAIAEVVKMPPDKNLKDLPEYVPNWVVFRAKQVGTTQLTLWEISEGSGQKIIESFDVTVIPDADGLKKTLHEIFPNEDIRVTTSGKMIILAGTVSGTQKLAKVAGLAEEYAPKQIVNMLQVGGIQQVMLEVRVAEMSRNLGRRLGINIAATGGNSLGITMLDDLVNLPDRGWPGNPLEVGDKVNAIVSFFGSDEWLGIFFDAMKEEGLLKILAEPTLIALSGQKASFLAGGEIPVPVPDNDGIGIIWKPFGVALNFTPVVLDGERISMNVAPEVSELDYSRSLRVGGYVVPALDTRRMATMVELRDGQSFAVAGLLKNYVRENIHKFPVLGDIPILGALFRSSEFQKSETELVIIVTPHLVKPLDLDKQPLPTDSFVEPNGFEFLMLGQLEGRAPSQEQEAKLAPPVSTSQSGLDGDFGYIIPE